MPDAVIHYAEQPSAPLSMMNFDMASYTLNNNLNVTFNLIWSVIKNKKNCHIVKLGTMGEYGTPDIDIEEGGLKLTIKTEVINFYFPDKLVVFIILQKFLILIYFGFMFVQINLLLLI